MRWLFITHSPSPSWLYTPQWMNRPKRASSNHSRVFRFSGVGVYWNGACALAKNVTKTNGTISSVLFIFVLFKLRVSRWIRGEAGYAEILFAFPLRILCYLGASTATLQSN